jgi:hypothetical protein
MSVRPGAGLVPWSLRILPMVEAPMLWPTLVSSPWICRVLVNGNDAEVPDEAAAALESTSVRVGIEGVRLAV